MDKQKYFGRIAMTMYASTFYYTVPLYYDTMINLVSTSSTVWR